MFTFTKKNPSEFLVEQRAKSNEQRTKNNEQKVTSNEQRAKSFTFSKSKGANQVEIRLQNHAPLITFYNSQYICLLIYNVQRFK